MSKDIPSFAKRIIQATKRIMDGYAEAVDEILNLPANEVSKTSDLFSDLLLKSFQEMSTSGTTDAASPEARKLLALKRYRPVISETKGEGFTYPPNLSNFNICMRPVPNDMIFSSEKVAQAVNEAAAKEGLSGVPDDLDAIAFKVFSSLSQTENIICLPISDAFEDLCHKVIAHGFKLSKEDAEDVLENAIIQTQKANGWDYEDALTSLLFRDFIEPLIQKMNSKLDSLEDSVVIFYTEEGNLQWGVHFFHEASFYIGDLFVPTDEDLNMGEDNC